MWGDREAKASQVPALRWPSAIYPRHLSGTNGIQPKIRNTRLLPRTSNRSCAPKCLEFICGLTTRPVWRCDSIIDALYGVVLGLLTHYTSVIPDVQGKIEDLMMRSSPLSENELAELHRTRGDVEIDFVFCRGSPSIRKTCHVASAYGSKIRIFSQPTSSDPLQSQDVWSYVVNVVSIFKLEPLALPLHRRAATSTASMTPSLTCRMTALGTITLVIDGIPLNKH